jgi:hypothetical protein
MALFVERYERSEAASGQKGMVKLWVGETS